MAIADDKDAVVVGVSENGSEVTLEVTVAPDDMGRVIGRKGRVASAMRTIIRAGAGSTGVNIEIKEF